MNTRQSLAFIVLALLAGMRNQVSAADTDQPKPTGLQLQRDSLSKQQQSLRTQLGIEVDKTPSAVDFLFPATIAPIQADCPALEKDQVESLIASAAKKQSLQPDLLRAVMKRESAFKPCAVSYKGAQGLMQLMPATAAQLHVADPFDPEQNVQAGAAFLKQLLKRYSGDLKLALVAYNAGATRADQPGTQYPVETQDYLTSIFADLGIKQPTVPEPAASEPAPKPTPNN